MKEYLRDLVLRADVTARPCLAREYLQARVLAALQEAGVFVRWAFVGGTALRFLFDLPRCSEDSDFARLAAGPEPEFGAIMAAVQRALVREGYAMETRVGATKAVVSAWLRFPVLTSDTWRAAVLARLVTVDVLSGLLAPPPI